MAWGDDVELDIVDRMRITHAVNALSGDCAARRVLPDGRVLRVVLQFFNAKLTLSADERADWYLDGW